MTDHVELTDLRCEAVLGVLASEQARTQPLVFDLVLEADLSGAAGGDLTRSIDYAAVQRDVLFLAQHGRWRLLESLGTAVANRLLAPPAPGEGRAPIDAVTVRMRKPTILVDAVPGVQLVRRGGIAETRAMGPGAQGRVLCETARVGAYLVTVDAGAAWDVPPTAIVQPVAGSGRADGRPMAPGVALHPTLVASIAADEALTLLVISLPPLLGVR